jgi:hypothetical protein
MLGAVPPLPNTSSWRVTQLKKAQGHLYLYLYLYRVGQVASMAGETSTESNRHMYDICYYIHIHPQLRFSVLSTRSSKEYLDLRDRN